MKKLKSSNKFKKFNRSDWLEYIGFQKWINGQQIDRLKWECVLCGSCYLTDLGFQYHFENVHNLEFLKGKLKECRMRIIYKDNE